MNKYLAKFRVQKVFSSSHPIHDSCHVATDRLVLLIEATDLEQLLHRIKVAVSDHKQSVKHAKQVDVFLQSCEEV